MKKIILIVFISFTHAIGYAQFYKTILPSADFTAALEKIVLDYRLDYHTIQVDSLHSRENDYEIYGSSVTLPGSTNSEILRFHSIDDTTAAFQTNFYTGDDFNAAAKAYENCIGMIKKSKMKWIDRRVITFSGKEEKPDQGLGFAISTLRLSLDDERYKNFCAQIEIRGDVTGWQVNASFLYKRSDTEGPTE